MAQIGGKMFQKFLEVASPHMPLLKDSKFKETGVLTPEEFVLAGDFLVHHCPTWRWETGDQKKIVDHLPANKQFLATKNVPCHKRLKQMQYTEENEVVIDEDDPEGGWVDTHHNLDSTVKNITEHMDDVAIQEKNPNNKEDIDVSDNESAGDMTDDEDDGPAVEDNDEAEVKPEKKTESGNGGGNSNDVVSLRTYDLYITYDRYYQTPRMWIYGYNENKEPLTADETYEDISSDHVKKTVTHENHPHISGPGMLSIHPCKHADVIKRIVEQTAVGGNTAEVHQYLLIFLKFVQSVLPTIEYDYTQQFCL